MNHGQFISYIKKVLKIITQADVICCVYKLGKKQNNLQVKQCEIKV